ncbi:4Fe-4S dicluster domain-containing protein [Carboxylicivirga sp. RSCT41]|uniref:4Fe-4S dicluster domain-containing protein n=1 Tax=Carboxylicivirga agarovorans TaxID=3417570 RepID=UPI003D3456B7
MIYFQLLFIGFIVATVLILAIMSITSLLERRRNAATKALLLIPVISSFLLLLYLPPNFYWLIASIDIVFLLAGSYLFIPRIFFRKLKEEKAKGNIDERTIMFSRCELKPGSERFEKYYKEFPQHKDSDEQFRKLPGLLHKKSTFYKPLPYNASDAIFKIVDSLHQNVEGKVENPPLEASPGQFSRFVKKWVKKAGATSVGITETKDYHWYSIGGRGDRYGKTIQPCHKYAIVFTVEMDHEMVMPAPKSSIIMESASQYLNSGIIATQIAQFIINCGYEARAHIDGNYQVVAPLVARDANLGEIGRMGLLMTPELGPRNRIGVITTNMPLPAAERRYDDSVEDFCSKCLKCAVNCPASAISKEDKSLINGVNRWQINSDSCFSYWRSAGTDCGRCMSTCPYSHPSNLMHNVVRWSIRNFPNFRYWAVKMDDFFYGRKSIPSKLPDWMQNN